MNYETTPNTDSPVIGTPVYYRSRYGDKIGWIACIEPKNSNVRTMSIAHGFRQVMADYVIVFEDKTDTTVPDTIAEDWLADARKYHRGAPIDESRALELLQESQALESARRAARQKASDEYAEKVQAWRDKYRDKIPADAKAVIVAELEVDDSDVMTDYFNTKTARTVILAFSKHNRDLFPEMRKAARNFSETADLADAPASAEHREKYSMGAGYYLKNSHRYSSGWTIRKRGFYLPQGQNDLADALPYGEWHVPDSTPETTRAKPETETGEHVAEDSETVGGFTISHHTHTKKGFKMAIVETPDRVDSGEFSKRLERARTLKGWYSRKWGKSPAGFAFKDPDAAAKFAEMIAC